MLNRISESIADARDYLLETSVAQYLLSFIEEPAPVTQPFQPHPSWLVKNQEYQKLYAASAASEQSDVGRESRGAGSVQHIQQTFAASSSHDSRAPVTSRLDSQWWDAAEKRLKMLSDWADAAKDEPAPIDLEATNPIPLQPLPDGCRLIAYDPEELARQQRLSIFRAPTLSASKEFDLTPRTNNSLTVTRPW